MNEELLGHALKGRREEAVIATKFGFHIVDGKMTGLVDAEYAAKARFRATPCSPRRIRGERVTPDQAVEARLLGCGTLLSAPQPHANTKVGNNPSRTPIANM